jgi:hypothetical protein
MRHRPVLRRRSVVGSEFAVEDQQVIDAAALQSLGCGAAETWRNRHVADLRLRGQKLLVTGNVPPFEFEPDAPTGSATAPHFHKGDEVAVEGIRDAPRGWLGVDAPTGVAREFAGRRYREDSRTLPLCGADVKRP